jgi:hypothetical protein
MRELGDETSCCSINGRKTMNGRELAFAESWSSNSELSKRIVVFFLLLKVRQPEDVSVNNPNIAAPLNLETFESAATRIARRIAKKAENPSSTYAISNPRRFLAVNALNSLRE